MWNGDEASESLTLSWVWDATYLFQSQTRCIKSLKGSDVDMSLDCPKKRWFEVPKVTIFPPRQTFTCVVYRASAVQRSCCKVAFVVLFFSVQTRRSDSVLTSDQCFGFPFSHKPGPFGRRVILFLKNAFGASTHSSENF